MENLPTPAPTLETPRLLLRKLTIEDAQDIFAYASDPDVSRYVTWETHRTIEDSIKFIQFAMQRYEKEPIGTWGIVMKETNRLIGTCDYFNWDPKHRRAEIGYVLAKQYWNQGLMTEAIREVIRYGFETMQLNRIEAQCFMENIASERVMQKVGMTFEGILREYAWIKNKFVDLKVYSLLRTEYRP
jgi:[ribosomal protein S5]-alanine N-acetyltransferase